MPYGTGAARDECDESAHAASPRMGMSVCPNNVVALIARCERFTAKLGNMETKQRMPPIELASLTRDLLEWLYSAPRTYAETMEAWRSTCPRFTIWEDALADDLVEVRGESGTPMHNCPVLLTPRGRDALRNDQD
jgi:hypothetical protein